MKSKARQTRELDSKGEPLEVRRHLRRLCNVNPTTEMKCEGKWILCDGFAEAREYAASHGYPGITIEPV